MVAITIIPLTRLDEAPVEPDGPTLPPGRDELVAPVEITLSRDDGSSGERQQVVVPGDNVVLDDDV